MIELDRLQRYWRLYRKALSDSSIFERMMFKNIVYFIAIYRPSSIEMLCASGAITTYA